MPLDDATTQLRENGIALLKDAFPKSCLTKLNDAATRCFEAVRLEGSVPEFNPYSHSVPLTALTGFGCSSEEMMEPLSSPGLERILSGWICNTEHSWVRKRFAPNQIPSRAYHAQGWHQDGGLGVRFPLQPGPAIPMTELLTCWIPLNRCGDDSPALEFVRGPQPALLHFTELDDSALRQRFEPQDFWVPELELGDGLIFLNSVLHRTYARPEMPLNRLSVEYRVFPRAT